MPRRTYCLERAETYDVGSEELLVARQHQAHSVRSISATAWRGALRIATSIFPHDGTCARHNAKARGADGVRDFRTPRQVPGQDAGSVYLMVKPVKEVLPRSRSPMAPQSSLTPRECSSNPTYF